MNTQQQIITSTIAGTGHRPNRLGGYAVQPRLTDLARAALERYQPQRVASGMALGWDQALAQAALDLGIPLIALVPFDGFDRRWPTQAQRALHTLLERATERHVITTTPVGSYREAARALHLRNDALLDAAQSDAHGLLLALWNGAQDGGTYGAIVKARKRGVRIVNLWRSWRAYAQRPG